MSDEALKTQAMALAQLIPKEAIGLILELQQAEQAVVRNKMVMQEVLSTISETPTPDQVRVWWVSMRNLLSRYQELNSVIYEVCLKLGPLSDIKATGSTDEELAFKRLMELDKLIQENKVWIAPSSDEIH